MNANELIRKMEIETGQRIDDKDSLALSGLFGAVHRAMGYSEHDQKDEIAAGVSIQGVMTPEYKARQESKRVAAELMAAGFPAEFFTEK